MEIQYALNKAQEFFRQSVKDLAQKRLAPQAEAIDNAAGFPKDAAGIMAQNRLFALLLPKELKGEGAGFLDFCLVIEELSKVSPTCGLICATQNIGARLIATHGSEVQKQKFLPKLASGQAIFGLALTEPEPVALDLSLPVLTAKLDGNDYVINGKNYFIVNGDAADVFSIFARTETGGKKGVTGFLAEKGLAGFSVVRTESMKGSEGRYACEATFKNCRISKDAVIGKEGEGMNVISSILPEISCLSAARAVGIAQSGTDQSALYAKQRLQFGKPIGQFQAIQSMLADMAAKTEASRYLLYKTASLIDQKSKDAAKFAAMVKYFATESAVTTTINAVQIHGGYGYIKDFPIERLLRNAKLTQVGEVNNLTQRVLIAKSMLV